MVVGAATMMTMTVSTAPPSTMDSSAMAVDDGQEDLIMATSKCRQWGQWTANDDCHRKRQKWAGAVMKATNESKRTTTTSNKSGRTTMLSSKESGQMRPASNKSGRRTCPEQAAEEGSKQQEREGDSAAAT
jgi:hypothetical protein